MVAQSYADEMTSQSPEEPLAEPRFDVDAVFALHKGGKLQVTGVAPLRDADDLALAYTPGVAKVSEAIALDPSVAHDYTWISNTVAVITDGTAVLGLGDIGPVAAMPVMVG
ncbi:MAG: malate dehydrogenase [Nocardioidaceae bacterium]|nr:malate dehydrogenase [Nocardioidaceae bacterium]